MEIEVFSQCLYDRAETPIIPETLILKGLIAWNCHSPTHLTWNYDATRSSCCQPVPPDQTAFVLMPFWSKNRLATLFAHHVVGHWLHLKVQWWPRPCLVSTLSTIKCQPLLCQNPRLWFLKRRKKNSNNQIATSPFAIMQFWEEITIGKCTASLELFRIVVKYSPSWKQLPW